MTRPALDVRGARYLTPAFVAPPTTARLFLRRRVRDAHERAYVAAKLATGFRPGDADDAAMARAVEAIRREALVAAEALGATMPNDALDAAVDAARGLQRRILAEPDDARACVGVAVVRALLDDAPDRCIALDRAVRDAARIHAHHITAGHEAVAEIGRAHV